MFGLFDAGQVCGAKNDDTHIFEHIRLRSKIVEFRHGKPDAPQSHPWVVKVDPYETVGVGERSSTAFTMLKMAVLAPTPRASVRTATIVNVGFLTSMRKP